MTMFIVVYVDGCKTYFMDCLAQSNKVIIVKEIKHPQKFQINIYSIFKESTNVINFTDKNV